ncbi:MAG: hypothetical protein UIH99_01630 [Alphaproteobacteria bacterium]|nr:hypothetical protein [Alphaproteobacteria bacterium]
MKKIFVLLGLMVPVCVFATDMCARDDIMIMVFDPQVNGTGGGSNAAEWTWWTSFAYGRVAGDATCLSAAEGLGRTSGTGAYYGTGDYAKTFITADAGLNGLDADGNERKYCWCKMTHPVSSRWVFNNAIASASACVACSSHCANYFHGTPAVRRGVFGSVGL